MERTAEAPDGAKKEELVASVVASAVLSIGGVGGGIGSVGGGDGAVVENGEGVVSCRYGHAWGISLVMTASKAKATYSCAGAQSRTWTPIKRVDRVARKTAIRPHPKPTNPR